ncbi:filamentous hemagglutinin N-terminal domain-containing protein [Rhodobacterales bacterium]|nr:filamentous hemagglutinin N-terminal domain-containing protein [Rhodobacterales bacterium]
MTAIENAFGRFAFSSTPSIFQTALATTAICTGLLGTIGAALAQDLPTGGSVAAGDVSIGQSGADMTVRQGSDRAIVNWAGFSIGSGNSVTFIQPGSTSAILNRVTGDTPSSIAGSLNANGRVYLINPNGIAITPSGTVKAGGGFVASSLDIGDEDFLDGNLTFRGNGASAPVRNDGVISIGRGGYAALIGGTVANSGLVAVPLGRAGLASGEQVTLDLSGDGFLQVAVPTAAGAEGDGALIENSGKISAEGGTVVMSAATAREAARKAVNLSGVVEARSVSGRNGRIVIGGGAGGSVSVSGRVSTASVSRAALDLSTDAVPAPKPTGGAIEITGRAIALSGAELDASGAGGGGSIRVGGGFQGTGDLLHAETTTVDAATVIRADATDDGAGGTIVLWSDDLTRFCGLISARGAGVGGGGDAEVSGKAVLAYDGFADLGSHQGSFGTLLLDPYNVTISASGSHNSSGTTPTGEDSVITVATLETALSGANVEISTGGAGSPGGQAGDITVADAVSWSSDSKLTLTAAGDIAINADLTATGQNAGLVLTPGGDYSIGENASVTLSGTNASLEIAGASYTLIHSQVDLEAINSLGLSGNYALAGDLDLSGKVYADSVIGTRVNQFYVNPFTGIFAGLGHVIENLTIDVTGSGNGRGGLFGHADGAVLRDVGLEGGSVRGHHYVGMLAGWVEGGSRIFNTHATGDVTSLTNEAGGLIGYSKESTISNSYSTGNVNGDGSVGGLIGYSKESTISNAHATGNVNGDSLVGGLIGDTYESTISNAHATGNVNGDSLVGGLIGDTYKSTISNAYATGNVNGDTNVGGLVGWNLGSVIDASKATGNVNGDTNVGGLVGWNEGSVIDASKATGRVTGRKKVGGLVGVNTEYAGAISQITRSTFDSQSTGQSSAIGDNKSAGTVDIVDLAAAAPAAPDRPQVPPGQPSPGQLADGAGAGPGSGQSPGTVLPAEDGTRSASGDSGLVLTDPLLSTPVCSVGTVSVPCGSGQENGDRS